MSQEQNSISGCVAARNSVKFGYPLRQCVEALLPVCDEVVLSYDPTTDDGTRELALQLRDELGIVLFESPWNMDNMKKGLEIGHQSQVAVDACSPDTEWRLCVQQDEAFHEDDAKMIREAVRYAAWVDTLRAALLKPRTPAIKEHLVEKYLAEFGRITGFDFWRPYFYGNIHTIRKDWTVEITRLTRKDCYTYDGFDGQNCRSVIQNCRNVPMSEIELGDFPVPEELYVLLPEFIRPPTAQSPTLPDITNTNVWLYHYSRIGDPEVIARRVRNVDSFFHAEENLPKESELPPYDFTTREYDSYAFTENPKETDSDLLTYQGTHPLPFAELYQEFE